MGPPRPCPRPALPAAPGGANAEAVPMPARGPRVATDKQIDLSGLRAFDATLNLETSAIEIGALKVTYADMNATLRNGVFKVSKLTGQFYSGAVDFAGTVDASKDTMTVDVAGTLQGIYVGEMLRGATGTEYLRQREPDGGGRRQDQRHEDRPAGTGQLARADPRFAGGARPSVRRPLSLRCQAARWAFASFATGIGSIFSTEMGFGSAVISGFINAQSTIEGDITLSKRRDQPAEPCV